MNGRTAKKLRRMAREEMAADKTAVDRELVLARRRGANVVINEPISNRGMYLQLKKALKAVTR